MKRWLFPVLAVLVAVILLVGLFKERKSHDLTRQEFAAARLSADSVRQGYEAAVDAIVEIQDSLSAIMPSDAQVMQISRGLESGSSLNQTQQQQVMQRISDLKANVQAGKQLIRRLEERLGESQKRIEGLERLVNNLKSMVAQREQTITALFGRVDSLRIRVVDLETDVAEGQQQIADQQQVIQDKDRELSTIHYVIGTKKSLETLGVVRAMGGFLGLGKTSRLSGTMDPAKFKPLDTSHEKVLHITGKKPVVLTGQSQASFRLVPVSPERTELRIIDPIEFRKVRYLVVQVEG
jgi:myosin heavy subunit